MATLVVNDESNENNEVLKYVSDAVKAMLMFDHSKKSFKQSDISGLINVKLSRKTWALVFQTAVKRLEEMGLILMETKNPQTKSYFLVSKVFPVQSMHKRAKRSETADRTLLAIILTFIFMRERPVFDVDLLKHLQELKIYNSDNPVHNYFGDIKKKLFIEFVSQLYLEKIVDKELGTVEIKWGERANAEIPKRSILQLACTIAYQNKIEPKNLVSHYMRVIEEENKEKECNMVVAQTL